MIALHLREEAHSSGLLQICQGTVEYAYAVMLFAAQDVAYMRGCTVDHHSTKNMQRHEYRIKGIRADVGLSLPVFVSMQVICGRRYPRSRDGMLSQRYFWQVKAEGGNLARRAFDKLLERPCLCDRSSIHAASDQ